MVLADRAEIPAAGWIGPNSGPGLRRHDLGGDPGGSLSVQVEALPQADAPAKPGADFPVSGRPPIPCARRRSVHRAVQGWPDRPRQSGRPAAQWAESVSSGMLVPAWLRRSATRRTTGILTVRAAGLMVPRLARAQFPGPARDGATTIG